MSHWLSSSPTILEFVPPVKRLGADGLEKRLRRLEKLLDSGEFCAINLPEIREEESRSDQGHRATPFEPRFPAREIALEIQRRFAIPTVVNHVVALQPAAALVDWARETHERYEIENFVLVGPAKGSERIGPTVPEANQILRETLPGSVRIGNICIPGRTSAGIDESERMEAKARQGANFFTTQILYRSHSCVEMLAALAERSPAAGQAPILVSLCPLRRPESVGFLRFLGVELEEPTVRSLCEDPDHMLERSIEHLVGVWRRITAASEKERWANPLGVNIAPVGPMPSSATLSLARALATPVTQS